MKIAWLGVGNDAGGHCRRGQGQPRGSPDTGFRAGSRGDPEYPGRHSRGLARQGGMRRGDPWNQEIGHWDRGQLWARSNDLPERRELHRAVECAGALSGRGGQHWAAARRVGNGFCPAGDEFQGGGLAAAQQSEARSRRFRRRWSERARCHGRDRCAHADRDTVLFPIARSVCGHLAGRVDPAAGRQRQSQVLRQGPDGVADRARTCGGSARSRAGAGSHTRQAVPAQHV